MKGFMNEDWNQEPCLKRFQSIWGEIKKFLNEGCQGSGSIPRVVSAKDSATVINTSFYGKWVEILKIFSLEIKKVIPKALSNWRYPLKDFRVNTC